MEILYNHKLTGGRATSSMHSQRPVFNAETISKLLFSKRLFISILYSHLGYLCSEKNVEIGVSSRKKVVKMRK